MKISKPLLGKKVICLLLFSEVLLLCLGTWQFFRWREKEKHSHHIQAKLSLEPLSSELLSDHPKWFFRRVVMRGQFLHPEEQHLQARVHEGRVGIHIITPFRMEDARIILVNRGWISEPLLPTMKRPRRWMTVEGTVQPLSKKTWFTPENKPHEGLWYTLDPEGMYPEVFFKSFYLQSIKEEGIPAPLKRPKLHTLENNHLGYMFTWYSLAVVLLVFVILTYRKP